MANDDTRRPTHYATAKGMPMKKESRVGVKPTIPPSAPISPPTTPGAKRPLATIEALLETVVAKQEASSQLLEHLAADTPTKGDLQFVHQQARRTHQLLEQHMREQREERAATSLRHDAIMGLLGDILSRLPSPPADS